ncbi:MAG: Rieske 2Fe-2S domain-containing protein [Burkholderiales bacterium]|nr:Rieske 2Fe-2S domain-containing protein [Burkholderiales bacterium]
MAEVLVGKASEFKSRDRKVVVALGREVGVFRLGTKFYAWENRCAHAGGPVCQGRIMSRVEEIMDADKRSLGQRFSRTRVNIVCPWHGYEYDIRTGCHQGNPEVRLKPVKVRQEGGLVYLVL